MKINYYKSITYDKSEFLGNQAANLLYRDISNNLPLINKTMLDDTVSSILLEAVNNHTDKTLDIDNFLSSIKVKITNQIVLNKISYIIISIIKNVTTSDDVVTFLIYI